MLNSPNPLTKAVHVNGAVIYGSLYSRLLSLSQGKECVIDHALNVFIWKGCRNGCLLRLLVLIFLYNNNWQVLLMLALNLIIKSWRWWITENILQFLKSLQTPAVFSVYTEKNVFAIIFVKTDISCNNHITFAKNNFQLLGKTHKYFGGQQPSEIQLSVWMDSCNIFLFLKIGFFFATKNSNMCTMVSYEIEIIKIIFYINFTYNILEQDLFYFIQSPYFQKGGVCCFQFDYFTFSNI